MINIQNPLLNISTKTDSTKNNSIDLRANDNNDLDEPTDLKNDAIDPHAFVMLLANVLAHVPVDQNKVAAETSNESAPQNENPISPDPALVNSSSASGVNNTDPIDNNPAVSWIDSESFQSFSLAKQTDTAQKDVYVPTLPSDTEHDAVTVLDGDQEHPVKADPSLFASNNSIIEKTKDDTMSLLQSASGVALGKESTVSVDTKLADAPPLSNEQTAAINNNMAMMSGPQQHVSTTAAKNLEVSVPLNHPQWGEQFSDHVVWMGNHQEIKNALIKIHPEELGPLEISVTVNKDSASVSIISHSMQARDIVDQSVPTLREMMAEKGLNLTDVHIDLNQHPRHSSQSNNGEQGSASPASADEEVQLVTSVKKSSSRLVDYFA